MSEPDSTKFCNGCANTWPLTRKYFHKRPDAKSGFTSRCRHCRAQPSAKDRVLSEMLCPDEHKLCRHCERCKPATPEFFPPSANGKPGFRSKCKECEARSYANYYAANRERMVQKSTDYEKCKPEKKREKNQRYYERHKEEIRDYYAGWLTEKKSDPEWVARERARKRRVQFERHSAKKLGGERHDPSVVREMYESQDGRCAYCEQKLNGKYEVEHMQPLSRGGTDAWDNICVSCVSCNRRKRAKTAEEYMNSL